MFLKELVLKLAAAKTSIKAIWQQSWQQSPKLAKNGV
jgi:hypothetical protein